MMMKGFHRPERWRLGRILNTFRKEVNATEWASDRIKEAFEQVAQDEAENVSIVQEIMFKSIGSL